MDGINIWVGVGTYGALFLRDAAARLGVADLVRGPGAAAGRPILLHAGDPADLPEPVRHVLLGRPYDELKRTLVQEVRRSLPPELRRGNLSQRAHIFFVGHLRELAAAGLDDVDHPLWTFGDPLGFQQVLPAILVACERASDDMRSRDEWAPATADLARPLLQAARRSAAGMAGHCAVVVSKSTDTYDPATAALSGSVSRSQFVLLFDLLMSLAGNPYDYPALKQLLLRTAFDEGCAVFGIGARGVDLAESARALAQRNFADLQALFATGPAALPPPPDVPGFNAAPPEVPFDVPALAIRQRPGLFDRAEEVLPSIEQEEARLQAEAPAWWRQYTGADIGDSRQSRRGLEHDVLRARQWADHDLVAAPWQQGATARQVHQLLTDVAGRVHGRGVAAEAVANVPPPPPPDLGPQFLALRGAVDRRPRLLGAGAMLAGVAVAIGLAAYAAFDYLGPAVEPFPTFSRPGTVALAAVSAGAVAAPAGYRWLLGPWRAVRRSFAGVEEGAKRVRAGVVNYRRALAASVEPLLKAEADARFATHLNARAERIATLAAAATQAHFESPVLATTDTGRNMFEELQAVPVAAPGFSGATVQQRFRQRYSLAAGPGVELEPLSLARTLSHEAVAEAVRPLLTRLDPAVDEVQPWPPHLLGTAPQVASDLYLPAQATPRGGQSVHLVLNRGDRCYALSVGSASSLAEALR